MIEESINFVPSVAVVSRSSRQLALCNTNRSIASSNHTTSIRRTAAIICALTPAQETFRAAVEHSTDEKFGFYTDAFEKAVSGEWFGHEVTFSGRTGAAQEIPERFVPEAFRTWGVSVTGFDSLTSSTVSKGTGDSVLETRFTRALPTVGCEADAIAGEVTDKSVPSTIGNGGFDDGSYTHGPDTFVTGDLRQTFKFCVTHGRQRARLSFGRIDEKVSVVRTVIEQWDADYCGGAILPGCGGAQSSFATDERLARDAITGNWTVSGVACTAESGWKYEPVEGCIKGREADESQGLLLLPRGLSVKIEAKESGDIIVEAAWLLDGVRGVVSRVYDSSTGILLRVEHVVEHLLVQG